MSLLQTTVKRKDGTINASRIMVGVLFLGCFIYVCAETGA